MPEPKLSPESFQTLLLHLDSDVEKAGEIYLNLQSRLTMYFSKRGCSAHDIEELADEVIDRIGKALSKGVVFEKSLEAYAHNTAKFVIMEYWRKPKTTDEIPELSVAPQTINDEDVDERLIHLRHCIDKEVKDKEDVKLILGYYNTDEKAKETRKKLLEYFNTNPNALKQKAFKLRKKLEKCINDCVAKAAIKEVC